MTDFDPDRDDELVSAYLDGEATEAERALVEGDPRLLGRVAQLRAVTDAVGAPVAPPLSAADTAISRALAAAGPVAPVVSLDAARQRRRRLVLVATSAAAAVVVLVLALPALLRDQDTDVQTAFETSDDTTADEAGAAGDEPDTEGLDGAGTPEESADSGSDEPTSTVAPTPSTMPAATLAPAAPPDDLGSFATRAEAQVAVTAAIDQALALHAELRDDALLYRALADDTCDARIRGEDDEVVGLVFAGDVVIAGETHQVLVYDLIQTGAQNGSHRIYEVTVPDCSQVSVETI